MERTVQLRHFTTFHIGGTPVRYFHPHTDGELLAALEECRRAGLSWRVLGGGSNLLVEEGQLPYAVIHIHAPGFAELERTASATVLAGAGAPTARLLAYCRDEGLGGLEFLAGLPGTVGGAIAGNAGAWGKEMCQFVSRLCVVSASGQARILTGSDVRYSYRRMELDGGIITDAELELPPRNPRLIALQMADYLRNRSERHPMAEWSAGCVFKNPPGISAGRLLERCGLKGLKVGDAEVSSRHANFIINRGSAAASDVLRLIEVMKDTVRRECGIELELEVRHWPARLEAA